MSTASPTAFLVWAVLSILVSTLHPRSLPSMASSAATSFRQQLELTHGCYRSSLPSLSITYGAMTNFSA